MPNAACHAVYVCVYMPDLIATAQRLIAELSVPFDVNNADHVQTLQQLWQLAWPGVPWEGVVSKRWCSLGFQRDDVCVERLERILEALGSQEVAHQRVRKDVRTPRKDVRTPKGMKS